MTSISKRDLLKVCMALFFSFPFGISIAQNQLSIDQLENLLNPDHEVKLENLSSKIPDTIPDAYMKFIEDSKKNGWQPKYFKHENMTDLYIGLEKKTTQPEKHGLFNIEWDTKDVVVFSCANANANAECKLRGHLTRFKAPLWTWDTDENKVRLVMPFPLSQERFRNL